MKREAIAVVTTAALALSACQTTGAGANYVKVGKGPAVDVAIAECRAYASKASHLVIGIGGPEAILIGAIATAAATAAKRAHFFEQCMIAQGYRKPGVKTAPQPAPAAPPTAGQAPAKQAPAKSAPARKSPARAG